MDVHFEKAVLLNNAGAKHLEREDFPSAIKALTMAFHCFKKTYNRNKQRIPDETRQAAVSNFNIDGWMRKMSCSDDNDVVVYHHPIPIPDNLEASVESCGLVSTAITFNLALANHQSAFHTNNQETLKRAARLYEYGFSLERIRGKFFVSPFFLVAVLNNLGHIHRSIDDIDRSHKCFRQLLSTLLYLTQIKGADPKDLEIFFGNTSFGLSRTVTRCAGAA